MSYESHRAFRGFHLHIPSVLALRLVAPLRLCVLAVRRFTNIKRKGAEEPMREPL